MRKIHNEKGAILIITAGFVLVFTMLGFASIHFAMLQNELAEKQKNSTKAFWIADGALEIAKNHLPAGPNESFVWTNNNPESPLPNNLYDLVLKKHVDYNLDGTVKHRYKYKWNADSFAQVNGQKREIEALISKFEIPDSPVVTNNPINEIPDTIVLGPTEEVEVDPNLTIENTLNVTNKELKKIADDSNRYQDDYFEGDDNLIYVDVKKLPKIDIDFDTEEVISIVVVNTTVANKHDIKPKIITKRGEILRGILLVIGDAELVDPNIQGIVFANGQLTISGTGQIINDPILIDQALDHLGATAGGSPKVVGWQEIVPKDLIVSN